MEVRTVAGFAFNPDPAAVHLDDLTRDGQPEAGAEDLAGRLLVTLVAAEQPLEELGRDADAVVADADVDLSTVHGACDHDLPAVGRVLDRVAEQVGDHLRDAVRVALDHRPALGVADDDVTGARGACAVGGVFEQRGQVRLLQVQRQPAGLDAVQVEHVVDHAVETVGVLVDVAGVALGLVEGHVLVADHLAETRDADQRGAELMAHQRDELALQPVEALQARQVRRGGLVRRMLGVDVLVHDEEVIDAPGAAPNAGGAPVQPHLSVVGADGVALRFDGVDGAFPEWLEHLEHSRELVGV